MEKYKIIIGSFFLILFLFFLIPPTDPDLGWHLRCGQQFWQEHSICSNNQFSVLLKSYHWVNHAWIYQAILFPIFKVGGLWGLSFLNAFIMMLSFLFFYLAIKDYQLEKVLAILLIIFFGWGVF